MKWLHLSSGNLHGGIETFLLCQAQHQSLCQGYEIEYGLCFEGRHSDELKATGARVHDLGAVRVSRPWSISKARSRLTNCLREKSFDGVISHGPWIHGVFGSAVRRAKLPLVFHTHNAYQGKHWTERWARTIKPDAVIHNSRFTAQNAAIFWPGTPETVILPPVKPLGSFSSHSKADLRRSLSTPDGAVVVMQAARMEAWKGHQATIKAFAAVAPSQAVLWLAGGAQRPEELEYFESLRTLTKHLKIEKQVRFLGDRRDVAQLLHAADLYCQPNLEAEPFGISFIEALHAGLPILAYDVGGPTEIVTPECGMLVPEHDEVALGAAMHALLNDDQLRRQFARGAVDRAIALCDPAQQIERQKLFLKNILSS